MDADAGESALDFLPEELWHRIFSYADWASLRCAEAVCRDFREFAKAAKKQFLGSFAGLASAPEIDDCLAQLRDGIRKSDLAGNNTLGFLFTSMKHGMEFPVMSDDDRTLADKVEKLLPPGATLVGCSATGVLGIQDGDAMEMDDPDEPGQEESVALNLMDLPPGTRVSPFYVPDKHIKRSGAESGRDWVKKILEDPARASPALDPSKEYVGFVVFFCVSRNVHPFIDGIQESYPQALVVGGATQQRFPLFVRPAGEDLMVHNDGVCGIAIERAADGVPPMIAAVSKGLAKEGGPLVVSSLHQGQAIHELSQAEPPRAPVGTARDVIVSMMSNAQNENPPRNFLGAIHLGTGDVAEPPYGHFPLAIVKALPNGSVILEDDGSGDRVSVGSFVQFYTLTAKGAEADVESRLRALVPSSKGSGVPRVLSGPGPAGAPRRPLGGLLFACNGRGPNLYGGRRHVDSSAFRRVFPSSGLAGFFCGGELGPKARAGCSHSYHPMQDAGTSELQGFTSVFALFTAPLL
eukprot:tig00020564_g11423.t1